jgi:hypothetical protein
VPRLPFDHLTGVVVSLLIWRRAGSPYSLVVTLNKKMAATAAASMTRNVLVAEGSILIGPRVGDSGKDSSSWY